MQIKTIVHYSIYLSIFIVMGLTPYVGFIKVGIIRITLMAIPVIFMTMNLGWRGALLSGLFWGVTSFLSALAYGSNIMSLVGIPYFFIISVLSRVLLGVLIAIVIFILNRFKINVYLKCVIISILYLAFNHILFLSFFALIHKESFMIIFTMASINIAIEWPIVITASLFMVSMLNIKKLQIKNKEGY